MAMKMAELFVSKKKPVRYGVVRNAGEQVVALRQHESKERVLRTSVAA